MKKEKLIKTALKTIDKIKDDLGLRYFTINIKEDTKDLGSGEIANCEVDIFENEFTITYGNCCLEYSIERIVNITIHELVHGLIKYYKMKARECQSEEAYHHFEEIMANHFTDIIERLLK